MSDESTGKYFIVEDAVQEAPRGDQKFPRESQDLEDEGQEPQMEISVEDVREKFPIKIIATVIG